LYAWRVEPHWVEFVRRQLPIRDLPPRLANRTLVQISDIHIGHRVDDDYVVSTFDQVAALQPDIVVMTGDLISYHAGTSAQLGPVCRHLPKGNLATLAILGNHDYGPAWSHPEIAQRVVETMESRGVTVLRNRIADVGGLQFAGLDDLWGTEFNPAPTVAAIDRRRPSIVLSHNPDAADLPVWGDYDGWILAGHTHGGQCKPPFLPPPLLPVRNRRYTCGEFELSGNRRMYINRGVGHLQRVRFNVRPEVTIFELRQG
jgi:predicted MPP superfamily phosphohydrolase